MTQRAPSAPTIFLEQEITDIEEEEVTHESNLENTPATFSHQIGSEIESSSLLALLYFNNYLLLDTHPDHLEADEVALLQAFLEAGQSQERQLNWQALDMLSRSFFTRRSTYIPEPISSIEATQQLVLFSSSDLQILAMHLGVLTARPYLRGILEKEKRLNIIEEISEALYSYSVSASTLLFPEFPEPQYSQKLTAKSDFERLGYAMLKHFATALSPEAEARFTLKLPKDLPDLDLEENLQPYLHKLVRNLRNKFIQTWYPYN